jgi:hypothetical protein
MRNALLVSTALLALALGAGPGFAASRTVSHGTTAPAASAATTAPSAPATMPAAPPAPDLANVAGLVGSPIVSSDGAKVGKVESVEPGVNGAPPVVVAKVGGLFGIGGKHVRIPVQQTSVAGDTVQVAMTKAEVKALPRSDSGAAPAVGSTSMN